MKKQFIFLYPIPEIISNEIETNAWRDKEGLKKFRKKYKITLNKCIDIRYRQKGFEINYAIFNETPVSDIIELKKSDRIIKVGLDFKTHQTKQPNNEYPYPNQEHILNQLNGAKIIRIAGFHMWDCVEKLAKRAYEKGLDVLVDEDLTEFFGERLLNQEFNIQKYPGLNLKKRTLKYSSESWNMIMETRKIKPWLWKY